MIHIVTDTASDITESEAKELGIELIQIGIQFGDEPFIQREQEDFERFFDKLQTSDDFPTTNQPLPMTYIPLFKEAKEQGDQLIYITLSSGLSGTYNTVCLARDAFAYDGIFIVDSMQAILTQRMLVERAVKLRDEGKSAEEIVAALEKYKNEIIVFGIIDTLVYLKKGGRIPPTIANIGELLRIKPVIVVEDGILKTIGKARGTVAGRQFMKRQIDSHPIDLTQPVYFGYSYQSEKTEAFMKDIVPAYGIQDYKMFPIGGVIGTHLGPHTVAISYHLRDANA